MDAASIQTNQSCSAQRCGEVRRGQRGVDIRGDQLDAVRNLAAKGAGHGRMQACRAAHQRHRTWADPFHETVREAREFSAGLFENPKRRRIVRLRRLAHGAGERADLAAVPP